MSKFKKLMVTTAQNTIYLTPTVPFSFSFSFIFSFLFFKKMLGTIEDSEMDVVPEIYGVADLATDLGFVIG